MCYGHHGCGWTVLYPQPSRRELLEKEFCARGNLMRAVLVQLTLILAPVLIGVAVTGLSALAH